MKDSQRVTQEEVKHPAQYRYQEKFVQDAVEKATKKVWEYLGEYVHEYPTAASENLQYGKQENGNDWVEGLELSRIVQSKKHPKFLIDYCAVCRLQSL